MGNICNTVNNKKKNEMEPRRQRIESKRTKQEGYKMITTKSFGVPSSPFLIHGYMRHDNDAAMNL